MKSYIKRASIYLFKFANPKLKVLAGNCSAITNSRCFIRGGGNTLIINSNTSLKRCCFKIGGCNNMIKIGQNVRLKGTTFWIEGDENTIIIGNGVTMENGNQLAACEGKNIIIGNDCMFSHSICVRTTDSHSILDKIGKRINKAKDIRIGNHVWVGMQTLILKGAVIPDNCIVGARTVVAKSEFEENSVLVGNPAKTIKTEVNWKRELL